MRRLLAALLVVVSIVAATAACGSNVPPTPTPRPCWIGFVGEYRLIGADGTPPTQTQLVDAARTIDARLRSMGVAELEVSVRQPDLITVQLPRMGGTDEARALITSLGDISFVPVPPGVSVETGEPMPPGQAALFGREGVSSAARGTDQAGGPTVDLTLTDEASTRLDAHAAAHFGEQLAIVVDGLVVSAPTLNARSFGGQMQISGGFTEAEASRLVAVLQLPPFGGIVEEVSFTEIEAGPGCVAGA